MNDIIKQDKSSLVEQIKHIMSIGSWLTFDFGFEPVTLEKIIEGDLIPSELFLPKHVFGINGDSKIFNDVPDFKVESSFRIIIIWRSKEVDPIVFQKFCVISVDADKYKAEQEEEIMTKRIGSKKDPRVIIREHKFIEACFEGDLNLVKDYLYNGVDPNCVNEHQNTGLMEAALNGQLEVCKIIVSLCKAELDINAVNEVFKTALHKAAYNNNFDIIKLLLVNGADPRLNDDSGSRPVDLWEDNKCITILSAWDPKVIHFHHINFLGHR